MTYNTNINFDFNIIDIKINNDDIDMNKLIWRCILNYIKGENNFKIMDILNKDDVKSALLELLNNNIMCEFDKINDNKLNIEITGIQSHSNELILEALVDDLDTYTMCFGILPKYNLEPNERFEQWYKRNIIKNPNLNDL